ncbi:MAG: hypothetical protein HC828_05090, partial [Blastochloris sp.]|nr:hypothetical protein [Blastochloris sp.]
MCLKPQPPKPIPPDTKALVGRKLDEATVYRFVGDVLFARFADEEFADLYPNTGQPAISPVLLSFVLIFKSLERCSNREAARNVRFRTDWQYALHLPLDYPGFDPSVIAEFRLRLLDNGAESSIFNRIFAELRAMGYYKPRGIQRTDSTHIYTHCRELHRIELMIETLRRAVFALLDADPDWTRATLPGVWEERYARRAKSERMQEDERERLSVVVGDDGQWLLAQLDALDDASLRELDAIETLRSVWTRHYLTGEDGHMRWAPAGDKAGADVIETPHDPEARWSTKHDQGWIGYMLQVTETDDAGYPHLITDIAITPACENDHTALPAIRARQEAQDTLPSERYVDSGYVSGGAIRRGREDYGEELIGPISGGSSAQSQRPDGLTHADFEVDWDAKRVTCPHGHTATITTNGKKNPELQATFPIRLCRACPLRPRCCPNTKKGRSLRFVADYPDTQAARVRQTTDAFKSAYRAHRSGVEGCLSAVIRGQGVRTTRYIGCRSNHLHALCAGAAVNLARSAAFRAGYRPQKRPARLGLRVGVESTPAA